MAGKARQGGQVAGQIAGFEMLVEKRQAGIVGRFFVTLSQLSGMAFGGMIDFVRRRKADGRASGPGMILLRFILFLARFFLDKKIISLPFPAQFRRRLEMLGPTYIKLGQILSLREDLLPHEVTDELKNLLDRLPAVTYERYRELLQAGLRRDPDEAFAWIDPQPLGSASLAQTHIARLHTGEDVVIKMLKPGVRETIHTDTRLLRIFGRTMQIFFGRYQPRRLVDEFCDYTLREVDLRNEANNAETFAANFRDQPEIRFPKIYRNLSTASVLTMELFRGIKPDGEAARTLSPEARDYVIELGVGSIIRMIFRDGFFHADLHPGNLLILNDREVGFIDLGMVGRFDRDMQKRMFYYMYSLTMGDAHNAARYLSSIALAGPDTDLEGFRSALAELYERWLRTPNFNDFSLAQVILQSIIMAGSYRIQYPGEIILMVKALVTIEGVGNLLEPGINIVGVSRSHIQRLLLSQFNPIRIARESVLVLPELFDTLTRSPLILNEGLRMIETNMKRREGGRLRGTPAAVFAGACMVAGAVLAVGGVAWPVWAALFLIGVLLALRT
jgi:ubiquinone biosynthesis protein